VEWEDLQSKRPSSLNVQRGVRAWIVQPDRQTMSGGDNHSLGRTLSFIPPSWPGSGGAYMRALSDCRDTNIPLALLLPSNIGNSVSIDGRGIGQMEPPLCG